MENYILSSENTNVTLSMSAAGLRFGIQKLTLLDYPGKVACTVFASGCDFRCPFCHNASLVLPDAAAEGLFSADEVLSFLKKREGVLDGVCVTGGEPLLHEEIFDFMRRVKALGFSVKLDTNGSFPERLKKAVREGLADTVAMDIKNSQGKYAFSAGVAGTAVLEKVKESVDFLKSGAVPYEFRTTVVKGLHTPEDFREIGRWIAGTEKFFLQKYVDSGDVLGDTDSLDALSDDEMRACLAAVREFVPRAELRGM